VYGFEACLDQGAYFELKRHRMMTQIPQRLTAELGFAIPRLIVEAGLEGEYRAVMEQARTAYRALAAAHPDAASYVVPNAFHRRVLLTLNLREVFHFCELRSAANAHFAMRWIALRMADLVALTHSRLAAYLRLPEDVDWKAIEREHFFEV
jgi:thymidylate synthase ThyX